MRAIDIIRNGTKTEEFDYLHLMYLLKEYKKPRDVVNRLLKDKSIIRIKKGLYIFGNMYQKVAFSPEILANLIYGPSYISYEQALSYYKLIPERVYEISSATSNRAKSFNTPVGVFSYKHIPLKYYSLGLQTLQSSTMREFIIAKPEKAITDILIQYNNLNSTDAVLEFLIEGMRISEDSIQNLDINLMKKIAQITSSKPIHVLLKALEGKL